MRRGLRVTCPMVGNARTAREPDTAIHDDRFAMRTVIEAAERIPVDGVEPSQLAASFLEVPQNVGADRGRSDGVRRGGVEQLDRLVRVDVQADADPALAGTRVLGDKPRDGLAVVTELPM